MDNTNSNPQDEVQENKICQNCFNSLFFCFFKKPHTSNLIVENKENNSNQNNPDHYNHNILNEHNSLEIRLIDSTLNIRQDILSSNAKDRALNKKTKIEDDIFLKNKEDNDEIIIEKKERTLTADKTQGKVDLSPYLQEK